MTFEMNLKYFSYLHFLTIQKKLYGNMNSTRIIKTTVEIQLASQ